MPRCLLSIVVLAPFALGAGCRRPEPLRTGLEELVRGGFEPLRGRRVALVTNPTGVDPVLESAIDILAGSDACELVAVWGPEHGARGSAQAGAAVGDAIDPSTGVPVFSLYGETRRPTSEMLEGVDVVVFDIQDIGVRTYTYLSTLVEVLRAAGESGVPVIVLDRPVPIGGDVVEGPLLEPSQESFVGAHTLPIRHGLTAGEFARLVAREKGIDVDLRVSRMSGYRRSMRHADTGLPWVAPSPNIPTPDAALAYAGTVLVEGTNLSEGRGTTRPFTLIGAPWLDAPALVTLLRGSGLPGVLFREATFVPTFSKHEGEECAGVEIHISDPTAYRAVDVALRLLVGVRELHPGELTFREAAFDRLAGTPRLREAIESGRPVSEVLAIAREGIPEYRARRAPLLLYE